MAAALLIIDMQKGLFTPESPRFDADGVVERINLLSSMFRKAALPVVFIQHDGTIENYWTPNSTAWEILDTLHRNHTDVVIEKTANNSFYNSKLNDYLKSQNIDTLYLTGCTTDFCVAATLLGALNYDYNLIVVKNGHTTADRGNIKAEHLIAHYNWVWQNLTPTKGTVRVIDFEQIQADGLH